MLIELLLKRKGGTVVDFDVKDEAGRVVSKRFYHFKPKGSDREQAKDPDVYLNEPHVCEVSHKGDLKRFLSIDGYEVFDQNKPAVVDGDEVAVSLPVPRPAVSDEVAGKVKVPVAELAVQPEPEVATQETEEVKAEAPRKILGLKSK